MPVEAQDLVPTFKPRIFLGVDLEKYLQPSQSPAFTSRGFIAFVNTYFHAINWCHLN